ncbi:MAG: hypothetical protein KAS86_00195, partial [Candidatus Omnitrophica bacterium]|nr:hypothetical protein [Candidatus Omnitrophota bacterium]
TFIQQQLPIWRDDTNRSDEQSEDKLNLQLCKFLDSHARHILPMVRFDHEEYQTGRRSVDLSASPAKSIFFEAKSYTIYDPVLVIECKRLPAPRSSREKEYVTGPTTEKISGGVQRFKLGLHGAKLNLAAIIGYVQDHSACHWHKKINEWISELVSNPIGDGCIWAANETLEPLEEDKERGIANCRSVHRRTFGNKIELHHLWITMNVEK